MDLACRVNRRFTDIDGRLIRSVDLLYPEQEVQTLYQYSPQGLLKVVTDDAGNTTTMAYDRLSRRIAVSEPDRGVTNTTYTPFGEIDETIHVGSDNVHTYHYDDLGRATAIDTPDGPVTFEWDTSAHGVGQIARTSSPFGVETQHLYDKLGRSIGVEYKDCTRNILRPSVCLARPTEPTSAISRIPVVC